MIEMMSKSELVLFRRRADKSNNNSNSPFLYAYTAPRADEEEWSTLVCICFCLFSTMNLLCPTATRRTTSLKFAEILSNRNWHEREKF